MGQPESAGVVDREPLFFLSYTTGRVSNDSFSIHTMFDWIGLDFLHLFFFSESSSSSLSSFKWNRRVFWPGGSLCNIAAETHDRSFSISLYTERGLDEEEDIESHFHASSSLFSLRLFFLPANFPLPRSFRRRHDVIDSSSADVRLSFVLSDDEPFRVKHELTCALN